MELQLFDTEINMSPVDESQIPKTENHVQEGETKEEIKDDPNSDYTIIDVLDKKDAVKETTEEEEPKDKKEKPASEQSADSSKFPYSTFAKALYEEGVISDYSEEEFNTLVEESGGEVEALIESVRKTIIDQHEAWKNELTPEGKDFLDALEKGVPLDKYIAVKTNAYSYLSIKEDSLADDEDLCKRLIGDDLKLRGFDDDDIKDQITDIDSLGKLETKAKSALKKLQIAHKEEIAHEKQLADKRQKDSLEANKKQLTIIKGEIDKLNEIIPGTKLNAKLKGEIYDAITTPAEQLANGQWVNSVYAKRAKDPVSWDIKVAYLDRLGIFDGKWDKILSGSKSIATKQLSDALKTGHISATGEPSAPESSPAAKDILRSMEAFKTKK